MLAYAAETRPAGRAGSPKALSLILAGHAVMIAAVMTAKMELVPIDIFDPTDIVNVPVDPPPPEPTAEVEPETRQPIAQERFIEPERPIVDMDATIPQAAFDQGQLSDIATVIGSGPTTIPLDPPRPIPERLGPRFATADSAVRPPYPLEKRRLAEEATLRLKLSIDARGRVVAVEPVGAADPEFLSAARRHILKAWRYKPASEGGIAVPSSTVITLSFRLEDV